MPNNFDIVHFVNDDVVKNVLRFWLNNLRPNHLENDGSTFKPLKKFVRMALEIHLKHIFNGNEKTRYSVDVLEKVKSDCLTDVTKGIGVPSFGGLDFANDVEI